MSYRKIEVQPAKSGRGKCKQCNKLIEKDALRIKVVDDTEFQDYIAQNGGRQNFCGEGMSRGYHQTEHGCISIQKYYVHLRCYQPIIDHPFQREYFTLINFKGGNRKEFSEWLEEKKNAKDKTKEAKSDKKPKNIRSHADQDDEDYDATGKPKKKVKKQND